VVEQYAEIDLLRAEFSIAEKNAFLQVAEKDVNNTVNELDILASAEKNTQTIIESWLSIAGFKNIAISFKK
jgi:outer membrane protein TolC